VTNPTAKTRLLVWERDNGLCVACGLFLTAGVWWSMQHRQRRGVGGNLAANLILLCGSATSRGCHRAAEDRSAETERLGYWIKANTKLLIDPADVPVFYALESCWYLLDNNGVRLLCDAPAAVIP
jgi:hypothetical protein